LRSKPVKKKPSHSSGPGSRPGELSSSLPLKMPASDGILALGDDKTLVKPKKQTRARNNETCSAGQDLSDKQLQDVAKSLEQEPGKATAQDLLRGLEGLEDLPDETRRLLKGEQSQGRKSSKSDASAEIAEEDEEDEEEMHVKSQREKCKAAQQSPEYVKVTPTEISKQSSNPIIPSSRPVQHEGAVLVYKKRTRECRTDHIFRVFLSLNTIPETEAVGEQLLKTGKEWIEIDKSARCLLEEKVYHLTSEPEGHIENKNQKFTTAVLASKGFFVVRFSALERPPFKLSLMDSDCDEPLWSATIREEDWKGKKSSLPKMNQEANTRPRGEQSQGQKSSQSGEIPRIRSEFVQRITTPLIKANCILDRVLTRPSWNPGGLQVSYLTNRTAKLTITLYVFSFKLALTNTTVQYTAGHSDSAEYKFRFTTNDKEAYSGVPGVKLSVTDLQVKVVIPPYSPNWVRLECHSMCHFTRYPTYIWYRDGPQPHQGSFDWFNINSEYRSSCAVQGSEHLPSPSVYAPETPLVGGTPPGVIKEGSSVNLTCTSEANPVAKYTWSKVTTGHSPGHTVQGQQLPFHPIQSSDSGQYLCTAENDLGTKSSPFSIDVKYGPKHTFVRPSPPGEIMEGGSVTLSCSSDANPAADYTWFKDNQPLPWEPRRPYTLDPVSSKDRGTYRCQAGNQYGYLGSNSVFIDVLYAPKTPSVSVRPPGEIKEGGSVTLSCSSDANPAADYTWFREHRGSVEELGENYTISNITTELGGNYYCEARNAVGLQNSTLLFLNVTATPSSPSSPSSMPTNVAAGTVAVLLATILLLIFLWMRRKTASRKARGQGGRPDTREESPPCPVYDNVSALTNRSAAQREPIEEQDDPHYASIHISRSKNQEVPRGFAGALVESDHTEQVLYSAINLKRPKAVPE
ncbi:unnamed protein product, partial [Arctogadus glacialis]